MSGASGVPCASAESRATVFFVGFGGAKQHLMQMSCSDADRHGQATMTVTMAHSDEVIQQMSGTWECWGHDPM